MLSELQALIEVKGKRSAVAAEPEVHAYCMFTSRVNRWHSLGSQKILGSNPPPPQIPSQSWKIPPAKGPKEKWPIKDDM